MERIALLTERERAELFSETATRKGMSSAVVEKDFWVCWVLGRLFGDTALSRKILFKGGTSLAKVFHLIERFSEDIDLILDWREVTDEDPKASRSRTKQDLFNKKIRETTQHYLKSVFLDKVRSVLGGMIGATLDDEDPHVIKITYPAAFSEKYLRPEIKLEVGPLASWLPNTAYEITPYCAEEFPSLFHQLSCRVQTIKAERTFWEKVTILHHEAHRPENLPQPARYSRHYYDLMRMAISEVKASAFHHLDLLHSVAAFKEQFYPRKWARYDLARPGTLKLSPPPHVFRFLKQDYSDMQIMIFGEIPSFDKMMKIICDLEIEINSL